MPKKQKPYKPYCCQCGVAIGKGVKAGETKKNYDGQNRRFHATCWKSACSSLVFHNDFIYHQHNGDCEDIPLYDFTKHYNYRFIATEKTPTNDITRVLEYQNHMKAREEAQKKNLLGP
jgi:hypothetical protein